MPETKVNDFVVPQGTSGAISGGEIAGIAEGFSLALTAGGISSGASSLDAPPTSALQSPMALFASGSTKKASTPASLTQKEASLTMSNALATDPTAAAAASSSATTTTTVIGNNLVTENSQGVVLDSKPLSDK